MFPIKVVDLEEWLRARHGLSRTQAQRAVYLLLEQGIIAEVAFALRFADTLLDLPVPVEDEDRRAAAERRFLDFSGVASEAVGARPAVSRMQPEQSAPPHDAEQAGRAAEEQAEQFQLVPYEPGRITPVLTLPLDIGSPSASGSLRNAFYTIISEAQRELTIASPYLDDGGLNLLWRPFEEAAERGVHIRLMVRVSDPASTPKRHLHAYRRLYHVFGAKINIRSYARSYGPALPGGFAPNAGSLHSKLLVADSAVAYIGSGEITASALTTNFETGVVVAGEELVGFYAWAFDLVWEVADPVSQDWIASRISTLNGSPPSDLD